MPAYSLYYYKQAHRIRPNDSRLLTALGEAYEKLDRTSCAAKCYERARKLGDIEGLAILKLAKFVFIKYNNMIKLGYRYINLIILQSIAT